MKAAVLSQYGAPCYGDFDEPSPQNGHSLVAVRAASLNAIDVALASGRHPFSPKVLPIVAGIEGVGVTQDRRVYFFGSAPPYGSMAQTTLVPDTNMFDVPDGLDDARAAALGNGGLAALMPLRDGAGIRPGERVLILGGTGIVGRLAIQCAAALGAGQIVVAGRDRDALDRADLDRAAELGATSTISLTDGRALDDIIRGAAPAGFDIILDYLGGEPASAAIRVLAPRGRLIQLGDRAGNEMTVAVAPLRAVGASIIGFMPAHYGLAAMRSAYATLTQLTLEGTLIVETTTAPLHAVEDVWRAHRDARTKVILSIGESDQRTSLRPVDD
jgi:NADPH:quinone reductase-like Zn-dependent oxidoreductase